MACTRQTAEPRIPENWREKMYPVTDRRSMDAGCDAVQQYAVQQYGGKAGAQLRPRWGVIGGESRTYVVRFGTVLRGPRRAGCRAW